MKYKPNKRTENITQSKKITDNRIVLITYADSIGRNLKELDEILEEYFSDAVGGLHILPFFPSSADRGFAPKDYHSVEPSFGNWEDIERLSSRYYLIVDYMINHISASSKYYQDFLKYKDESEFSELFIRYRNFWNGGDPTPEEIDQIYKRKPRAPYAIANFADGSSEKVWSTFDVEQIDIDWRSKTAKRFIRENLENLCLHGASVIRLDAFAYTTKRAGTSCFFIEPDVWELLKECNDILAPLGVRLLPEIHEHFSIQKMIEEHGYYVYDFALPMLLLNALYYGQSQYLKHWLTICPRLQYTTLDTHDGIGVVDVAGLLPDKEIEKTKEDIYKFGANVKKIYSTTAYNNLDVYQVNCTYYSALGENDAAYLIARAVQFFAPGIPQVYYVGMFAGRNDLKLLEETREGRNINRHYYTREEIDNEVKRPVVRMLLNLMKFRNECQAFNGDFFLEDCSNHELIIVRESNGAFARLIVDFEAKDFSIVYRNSSNEELKPFKL